MTINFNNTGVLSFSTTFFSTLTTYSILTWVNVTAYNASDSRLFVTGELSTTKLVYMAISDSGDGSEFLFFSRPNGSSNPGRWQTTTDPVTIGTKRLLAVTYDNSSLSNDPILYSNGVSQSITETATPATSGAIATANYANLGSSSQPYNGIQYNALVYNRILSAAEIADAYNSRLAIPTYNGLVFAPNLCGASGGVGDGSTLTSSNLITDTISGAQGTPSGSPVLYSETYLTME